MDVYSIAMLLFSLGMWLVRFRLDFHRARSDAKLLSLVWGVTHWTTVGHWLLHLTTPELGVLFTFITSLASIFLIRAFGIPTTLRSNDEPTATKSQRNQFPSSQMRPLLFPCRTTHTRMFPKKHSFSYSYLFVGIPVDWQGSIRSVLSASIGNVCRRYQEPGRERKEEKTWFTVEADDYLDRGNAHLGLQGNLHAYLRSEACVSPFFHILHRDSYLV